MTEKEILDGNILIADFMGWQSYWLHGGKKGNTVCLSMDRLYGYILPKGLTQKTMNDEPFENVEYLRFHTSWDWLMLVVEKIGRLYDEIHLDRKTICDFTIFATIETVFQYVIEFIKWYNEIDKL